MTALARDIITRTIAIASLGVTVRPKASAGWKGARLGEGALATRPSLFVRLRCHPGGEDFPL